jgi:hypothetical protein
MPTDFDPANFVNTIGERLVMEFEHASVAGTPGLIGSARENPARKQLERLMPGFVEIGSGIVMDSFGGRSRQADIVLFERDCCPVYSINDTPKATYFPIEGVMAVGEVKSVVDKATLFDALDNVRSAKCLKRFSERTQVSENLPPAASYRPYGQFSVFAAVEADEYDQQKKFRDQLYGFIICKSFSYSQDAVLNNLVEFESENGPEHMPNFILSLEQGFVQHASLPAMSLEHSPMTANGCAFVPDHVRGFTFLVHELSRHAREGRSVPLYALDRYMASITGQLPASTFKCYAAKP